MTLASGRLCLVVVCTVKLLMIIFYIYYSERCVANWLPLSG